MIEKNAVYWGSVRFYKHVIYAGLVATGLFVLLGLYFIGDTIGGDSLYAMTAEESLRIASETGSQAEMSLPKPKPAALVDIPQIDYQLKYPGLYGDFAQVPAFSKRVAYLTFDDGPSARTLEILNILKQHSIRATFFVVTKDSDPAILKRIVAEGHTLGIHSHSHRYGEIYSSVERYLDDFDAAYERIFQVTSVKPRIFRLPGGSINAYNRGFYQELLAEMLRRGFVFYDWNVATGDADPNANSEVIVRNVRASVKGQDQLVILAHDSEIKRETIKALPAIIELLEKKGYSFDRLDSNVKPVTFSYQ